MQDLTQGSIARHLATMAAPIAAGMLLQTLYYVVDLYFVVQLGDAPIAGVSATSPVMFVVFALTQILGVGTVALMSHAVGRKDRADANHVFNQSVALAALCAATTLAGGFLGADPFMRTLGADEPTVAAGVTYLRWFAPGLALQFALVAMASALRGTGVVKPAVIVQAATVALNIVLLPTMAIAFAAAPIAGQNFGAKRAGRDRETSRAAAGASCAFMALLTLFCQWRSAWLVRAFTADPAVIEVRVDYLRVISWNFVGAGVVFVCSSLFQGLGNTWPSLVSSASRVVLFAVPAVWLSRRAGFRLVDLWHLSVATVVLQAILSLLLLRREFRARLETLRSPSAVSN